MIFLFIWMIIIGAISFYYGSQAIENRKEEYLGKLFRVMLTPLAFDKKYFTDKGLIYRRKAIVTQVIGIVGFIIIVMIVSGGN